MLRLSSGLLPVDLSVEFFKALQFSPILTKYYTHLNLLDLIYL